ncbi:bifunctional 2-C-methyl-D-erythritol 4-phosphate cytidylyltransferase/2-C-methyl-D-erythritol 2,4-cyclodiphosphate synthase [Bartonella sp. DGB1]|uniref:bifunctional 2-C-methyl-D-erythritol 4-phosphate cytidylyltransferase/2-C-methyl-D-erythritol 2,4-cyclodiphosphate synthase n=1 Tax=Bartonella sp. DGB1 TaxID=3239807 RepID=UPI003525E4EF
MNNITNKKIAAIILAAGTGSRANSPYGAKQYHLINNKTILEYNLDLFTNINYINEIILVVNPKDLTLYQPIIKKYQNKIILVNGGETRQKSTYLALQYLSNGSPDYVFIHDSARPFITEKLLDNLIIKADKNGVIPILPIRDTVKKIDLNKQIVNTINRDILAISQTPQLFYFPLILKAHIAANNNLQQTFTDDASIAEFYNIPMVTIMGEPQNIKITFPEDLEKHKNYFPDIRTAMGYDIHKLVKGDKVILCGVSIPHSQKLEGHSDADVILHALADALLATAGEKDIGVHFPPSDQQWKNAPSKIFVEFAANKIKQKNGIINNIDITLICEEPKIAPYVEQMKEFLQNLLTIKQDKISIKATTNETLGFIGRKEGIAAFANVTVYFF